jgi:hypothetical protein
MAGETIKQDEQMQRERALPQQPPHSSSCPEMSDGLPSASMPYALYCYRAFSSALYGDANKFDWEKLWAEMLPEKRQAWAEAAAAVTGLYQSWLDSDATGVR